ncbi:MAG: hypothetical protein HY584_03475 [Candidatus Omnitrophica bacterium]|nr:hypothetical protein [Candidatus Omnitrophota bacterium]
MRNILVRACLLGASLYFAASARADLVEDVADTTKAAIGVPVNLAGLVGGVFKTAGEILLLPSHIFS